MFAAFLQNKIAVIVIAILLAGGVWYGMSQTAPEPTIAVSGVAADGSATGVAPADPETQEILNILATLRAVTLDGSIFSDQVFRSLKDFSTTIVPEPVGRPDPFAPLGVSGGTVKPPASAAPAAPASVR